MQVKRVELAYCDENGLVNLKKAILDSISQVKAYFNSQNVKPEPVGSQMSLF